MESKSAEGVVFYGMDMGSNDRTTYWLYCDGQITPITEEEYWKLFYERSIADKPERQEQYH